MAQSKKGPRTQVDARVYDQFECLVRLREGAPVSTRRPADALEVQDRTSRAPTVCSNVAISTWSDAHFFCGLAGDPTNAGVFIATSFPLVVGSTVELEFERTNCDVTLHVSGEVRWLREFSAHGPRGIGISFGSLSVADRRRIEEFCIPIPKPALQYAHVG